MWYEHFRLETCLMIHVSIVSNINRIVSNIKFIS